MKFGAIMQACRERAGLTQLQIAAKLNISRSCVSKIENDQKALDAQTLLMWTEATGAKEVLVAFLMGMDGFTIMQNLATILGGF